MRPSQMAIHMSSLRPVTIAGIYQTDENTMRLHLEGDSA